jgi:solute:Na+ symporter, SSS family
MTPLIIIAIYLALLLALGLYSSTKSRGTSKDFFVASHSIGPFMLLMSVFGTTMTAFALVGSTGKAYERGIGVYGLMASMSGIVHAAVFFLIGIRLWVYGKKYGFVTQIQFFRARFESDKIGYLLFPILVGLVIPYLLIGVIGAGKTLLPVTAGAFPDIFANAATPQWAGGIPPWLSGLVVCLVVLTYVFAGGSRGAAWANTFQTLVFMVMGLVAFFYISSALGGLGNATKLALTVRKDGKVVQTHDYNSLDPKKHEVSDPALIGPDGKAKSKAPSLQKYKSPKIIGQLLEVDGKPTSTLEADIQPHLTRKVVKVQLKTKVKDKKTGKAKLLAFEREYGVPYLMFLTYLFIPLSVGMFPHLFQHWLTAKSAKAFRLTVIAHPIFIMIVWVPCVLMGVWASGLLPSLPPHKVGAVLGIMVKKLVGDPILSGLLTAGILAAIMSSLDSQFLCLGTMFTNDIVLHRAGPDKYTDKQIIWIARAFVIAIVTLTYFLSLVAPQNIFDLAVWCFSGFGALFPLVVGSLYWKRATTAGAFASIIAPMIVWVYFFQASGYGGEYTVGDGIMPVALCFAVSAIAFVTVSLVTTPPSDKTIQMFFPDPKA